MKYCVSVLAAGMFTSVPAAHAQSLEPASAPADTTNPAPSTALGDIIVTAQKRREDAQRIPVTVTALSGDTLARQQITDLFQAVTQVPGVIFSRAPDDGLALTFRGLGSTARPQAFDQSIALFTDDIFLGKGRLYSSSLFDLDRVEFIKGAQSTLLGKNASMGAISLVSRQPGDHLSFEGRAGYEAINGGYLLDAAGDAPLSDKVSLRVAAHYNDLDGWVRNDLTGHNGPEHRDLGLRAILRADLTDSLRVTGSFQYADNRQIGASYHLVGAIPAAYGPGTLTGDIDQFTGQTASGDTTHRTTSEIAGLKAELQLGDYKLISQTGYVGYQLAYVDDFDFSKDDSNNFLRNERYRQLTQEIRLESPTGRRFDYMIGGFGLWSHWNSLEGQLWHVPAFPPPPDPTSGQLFNGPFHNAFVQDQQTYSVFASGTLHLAEALRLSGGVRYTHENKDVVYGRTNSAPFTIWNQFANPPFAPTPLNHSSSFVDGDVSLQYDLSRGAMAYISYGHGSKSGGYVETNTIAVPPPLLVNGQVPPALVSAGAAIKDEFSSNYEVGIKTWLFDRRLRFNIVGFWTDVTNFQDTVFTGGPLGFLTYNGPARSRGVEVEAAVQATPALRLKGDLTYADATAVIQPIDPATNTPEVDGAGNPILRTYRRAQAPLVVFNLGAEYQTKVSRDVALRFTAGLHHRDMMYNQRQEEFPSKPLTTLDLSLGIESTSSRWGLDIAAKNVTNAASEDFASPSVDPRFGAFYSAYVASSNPGPTVMITAHIKY